MNSLKILIGILILAIMACGDPDPEDPITPDILPGIGVKEVSIGSPAQKAVDAFGTLQSDFVKIDNQYFHYIDYTAKGILIKLQPSTSAVINLNTNIESIELYAPYNGTSFKKIGIGSTKDQVRSEYGTPTEEDPFVPADIYDIGVQFQYDGSNKTNRIILEKK